MKNWKVKINADEKLNFEITNDDAEGKRMLLTVQDAAEKGDTEKATDNILRNHGGKCIDTGQT